MLCALILHTEWKKGRNLVHSGVAGKLSAACVFSVVHAYLVVCVCVLLSLSGACIMRPAGGGSACPDRYGGM